VITPRRTRLVRVPHLHAFRRAISVLSGDPTFDTAHSRLVVVPTRGAARQLRRTLEKEFQKDSPGTGGARAIARPDCVTRDELYDCLHARLTCPPRRLTAFERDAVAQASARSALSASTGQLPFQLRPGLVAQILRFYDQLRRQSQQVKRFEELIEEALSGAAAPSDRGAERMGQQTRFLTRTFLEYERRVLECGACDEHVLRDRLMEESAGDPIRHVIVTVPDWIADPDGLFVADFDLLARIPGLAALDIVSTEALLGSGFHERLHNWWPGIDEVDGHDIEIGRVDLGVAVPRARPVLVTPPAGAPDQPWFTHRDREEELVAIARRIKADRRRAAETPALDRTAVVFKRPLPYLYLASETFGAAGIPYQTYDALPLAGEPTAAAIDLILDLVETSFARAAIVALLRSPHFRFVQDEDEVARKAISALDRALSGARYLGDLGRLEELGATWTSRDAVPALEAALAAGRELAPLLEAAPAAQQIRLVLAFFASYARPLDFDDPFAPRERRARAAVVQLLTDLAAGHAAHHDPLWTIDEVGAAARRWIEEETFAPESSGTGVHLLDDQAARYGDFDDITLVGLVENDWPERPRRNIFCPPSLLKTIGWPSEKDRRGAADARFLDLLASASQRVVVSTFALDDEALVARSAELDQIPRARLSTVAREAHENEAARIFMDEALAYEPPALGALGATARRWAEMRIGRSPSEARDFHGSVGAQPSRTWSVSALETYLGCPFKFFAQHVLRLEEEPDEEEVMDPRRQGQLVHEVFEAFFRSWQAAGRRAVTQENLDEARAMFAGVVDRALEGLPEAEAGLERTRLLGSAAAAGLGEAVFRMEAERPVAVVERLIEHRLEGEFAIAAASGTRVVFLRGKADRLDLLEDGTFRLIDYKLGRPPSRARALQLPIYSVCAEQRLVNYAGRQWTLGQAAYLAFKGPRRVVPLFSSPSDRAKVLGEAQRRLADTLDAIEGGEFPPTPDDVYRCETCGFASVCRKDYVGDV